MMPICYHSFSLLNFDPLNLYRNLCPTGPGFLESLNPRPKTGQFSIIPLNWSEYYRLEKGSLSRTDQTGTTILPGKPLTVLAQILRQRAVTPTPKTPFSGGFFGYFGYDLAAHIENLPQNANRDLSSPALELYWVDATAVYNHKTNQLTLASLDHTMSLTDYEEQIRESQQQQQPSGTLRTIRLPEPILSPDTFISMVKRGKEYIAAGDIYQINLSCRFDGEIAGESTELYRQLRQINPSPFSCFLHLPDTDIISSSPERLVSLRDGLAETRPIAGTRPRGYTPASDQLLGEELLGHPKERAEHIMLLDLERNDLGKVCQAGSIKVDELMVLERYSHVTHIVSRMTIAAPLSCSKRLSPGAPLPECRKNAAWR